MLSCLAALALLPCALVAVADSAPGDAFDKLVKEYNAELASYQKAFAAAKTDAEREKVFKDKHPSVGGYSKRFLALAQAHPRTESAADCLFWVASHQVAPTSAEAKYRVEAMALLAKDHLDSDRTGTLCTLLVPSLDSASESFLRTVHGKSKRVPVQARATASLAVNLRHRARVATALDKNAEARKQYESAFGKADIEGLLEQGAKKFLAQSEKLFEETTQKFADFPHPTHGKLKVFAQQHLLAMRKPVEVGGKAPPLTGKGIDGKEMSLEDHLGKVVLLDFWSDSFAPCRAMYDYERGLVKRLAGKPFVLVGVNGDRVEDAKKAAEREKMTWRSFSDGGTGGPVATRWDVGVWPTLVLLDHKGVVKHVFVGWPEAKKLDSLVDGLVDEVK